MTQKLGKHSAGPIIEEITETKPPVPIPATIQPQPEEIQLLDLDIPILNATASPETKLKESGADPTYTPSWLGEEEALRYLENDPITDPNEKIQTGDIFLDEVPEESNLAMEMFESTKDSILESVDQTELLYTIQNEPINMTVEYTTTSTPIPTEAEPIPTTDKVFRSPFDTVSEESEPMYSPDTTPTISTDDPDLQSNVVADVPTVDPSWSTGQESSDDLEFEYNPIESNTVETKPTVEELPTSVEVSSESEIDEMDMTSDSTDTEEQIDIPLIPSMESYREPKLETIIPLQREEYLLQIEDIIPDENDDPRGIRQKQKAWVDPSTFPGHLNRASQFFSNAQSDCASQMKDAKGPMGNNITIDNVKYGDAFSGKKSGTNALKDGVVLSGQNAIKTAMVLICGIRKVVFYNSGFNVTIRPPLLNELHQYYLQCRNAEGEFGRSFGQWAFMPADVEIKKATMQLFESLVIDSNLKDFDSPGTIRKHLSVLDYETCLWGMATLMFPEGTEVEMFCNKRNCGHVDTAKIDVVKMRFNDYSKLTPEAIKYCCASGKDNIRTTEDLDNYRTVILPQLTDISVSNEWSVHLEVPSIDRVIDDGESYVADMASKIQLNKAMDVADFVKSRYFRVFAPWINRVTNTNTATNKHIHFSDPIKLPEIIDALQLIESEVSLSDKVITFMRDSRITHFGYLYTRCPNCKTVPDTIVNGIIPCDMQQSFFTLTMDRIS